MRVLCRDTDPEWKALRWNAITASRLPALLGLVPYEKRSHDELLHDYAMRREIESTPSMEAGQRFQDVVVAWAMELHPAIVGATKSGELVMREEAPWLMASLDWRSAGGPVEAKCHHVFSAKDWKDGPPEYVKAQCQVQAWITEAAIVPVVEWSWGILPALHIVEADPVAQAALVSEAKRLWAEISAIRAENGDL